MSSRQKNRLFSTRRGAFLFFIISHGNQREGCGLRRLKSFLLAMQKDESTYIEMYSGSIEKIDPKNSIPPIKDWVPTYVLS